MLVSPPQPTVAINIILVMSPNISCNITAVFSPQQSYGHSIRKEKNRQTN